MSYDDVIILNIKLDDDKIWNDIAGVNKGHLAG